MRAIKTLFFGLAIMIASATQAQDDIDALLNEQGGNEPEFTTATFKSTRIINGHSVEQLKAKHLDFRISHRFGTLEDPVGTFFGLDGAITHLGLDYGITDRFMIGVGRSTFNKTYNGYMRLKLLRQSSGSKSFPFTLSYIASSEITSSKWSDDTRDNLFTSRMTFTHQLLIARKFNDAFSLQFNPMIVHKNLVATSYEKNDLVVLGVGGRYKLSTRTALTGEYFYAMRGTKNPNTNKNAFSIGVDLETGGHVFQLFFTTASTVTESGFAWGDLNGDFWKKQIHFGFNITRTFSYR